MTSLIAALKKESPVAYLIMSLVVVFGSANVTSSGNQTITLDNLETSVEELSDQVHELRSLVSVHTTQLQIIELQLDDLPELASKDEIMEQRIATLESRMAVLEAFEERD